MDNASVNYSRSLPVQRETCPICGKSVGLGGPRASRLVYHGSKAARCPGSMGFSVEHREREEKWLADRAAMTVEECLAEALRGVW